MDILLTVNLLGSISGPVAHTTYQLHTVDITPLGSKFPKKETRKILHTDRERVPCFRKTHLDSSIVNYYQSDEVPYWSKAAVWKTLSAEQRLKAHLDRFDEGYGIDYEAIEHSEE